MIIAAASFLEKNSKYRYFRYWLGKRSQDDEDKLIDGKEL